MGTKVIFLMKWNCVSSKVDRERLVNGDTVTLHLLVSIAFSDFLSL